MLLIFCIGMFTVSCIKLLNFSKVVFQYCLSNTFSVFFDTIFQPQFYKYKHFTKFSTYKPLMS